ncbi:hypothetical protein CVT24_002904 [Panaeolus cyanescens]|uniref:MARVEL domain-containing protein n=1 Tax=Panaeolus cyanescens TaxID=181874 RepID=A0A409W8L2_9AGAR|nr:hypothetical protein CVT24_002904 [Panaeolus cyanescens]
MGLKRTPFYSLALFTAVLQTVFGTLAGFVNGNSPFLWIFGKLAGGLSIATWIWLAILFRYNHRPLSSHPLCRSLAHFISLTVLGTVWLAFTASIIVYRSARSSGAGLAVNVAQADRKDYDADVAY